MRRRKKTIPELSPTIDEMENLEIELFIFNILLWKHRRIRIDDVLCL
jgi:hypothetical protein